MTAMSEGPAERKAALRQRDMFPPSPSSQGCICVCMYSVIQTTQHWSLRAAAHPAAHNTAFAVMSLR